MLDFQTALDPLQKTITDVLVEQLRGEIIRGVYSPGTRLPLRDLADRFRLSTMPIREALQLLEAEGLVTGEARKGFRVTELSPAELDDIYTMRATLEAMATRVAVPRISDETIATLRKIVAEIDTFQNDAYRVFEANTNFHSLIYTASGRGHLCSIISMLRNRAAHYFHNYMLELETHAQTDHLAIIEACQDRDADRAADIMYGHIARAGLAVVEYCKRTA
ncbi:MAG TPA: GntR family transcriptional regulator [Anaerolineales bacterium]|nr:GntR family transcriptional regulator [Anaerolineales bacterium]